MLAALSEVGIQAVLGASSSTVNLQNGISIGAVALVPIAIGIAVFRYRLYDIDVVINKTLVYAVLAALITGVYVVIVVGIGSLIAGHGRQPSLLLAIAATAVVAVIFQPVRERVQRLANRLVYGRRATPYEVLARFAERMAGTYATEDLLPRMAQTLAEATAAVRADVWLADGDQFRDDARWPRDVPSLPPIDADLTGGHPDCQGIDRIIAVRYRGDVLGALSVAKQPGEALTPTEDKLMVDLAAQIGLVLRNVRLWEERTHRLEELRASRQRLVAAQDAERRRIERNIHDGAQQQLVSLAVKLSLAESMIGDDADGEREMLAELQAEARAGPPRPCQGRDLHDGTQNQLLQIVDKLQLASSIAGQDVPQERLLIGELRAQTRVALTALRELAHGMNPPVLAASGLAGAVAAPAAKCTPPAALTADGLRRYPEEIETALYFCCAEALQNSARHAPGATVTLVLAESEGQLSLSVADDGPGFDVSAAGAGAGLQNMRDRLSVLGGRLDVQARPGAGTTISGCIPAGAADACPPPAPAGPLRVSVPQPA